MRQKPSAQKGGDSARKKRAPGRPRSEQARLAILRSTLKLLADKGFSDLTIESVADHAGVGKATVYRWWPDKAALIADAFACSTKRNLHFPDTGSVRTDMSQQMRQLVKIFRSRRGRIVSAMLAAGQSDRNVIAAFRERFIMPRRREAYATLRRGILRGQLRKNIDMDLLLDSLYGPIYMRFLIGHDRLTPEFVEGLCELTLSGSLPRKKRRLRAVAPKVSNF
jgi:AcrR family transcriptional regulator